MPYRTPWLCQCGFKIAGGEKCPCQQRRARERKARFDSTRPDAKARGYATPEWKETRAAFLSRPENYYCSCGCGRRSDTVDHVVPARLRPDLFHDFSNLKAMAFGCHSRKAQRKDHAMKARARTEAEALFAHDATSDDYGDGDEATW